MTCENNFNLRNAPEETKLRFVVHTSRSVNEPVGIRFSTSTNKHLRMRMTTYEAKRLQAELAYMIECIEKNKSIVGVTA